MATGEDEQRKKDEQLQMKCDAGMLPERVCAAADQKNELEKALQNSKNDDLRRAVRRPVQTFESCAVAGPDPDTGEALSECTPGVSCPTDAMLDPERGVFGRRAWARTLGGPELRVCMPASARAEAAALLRRERPAPEIGRLFPDRLPGSSTNMPGVAARVQDKIAALTTAMASAAAAAEELRSRDCSSAAADRTLCYALTDNAGQQKCYWHDDYVRLNGAAAAAASVDLDAAGGGLAASQRCVPLQDREEDNKHVLRMATRLDEDRLLTDRSGAAWPTDEAAIAASLLAEESNNAPPEQTVLNTSAQADGGGFFTLEGLLIPQILGENEHPEDFPKTTRLSAFSVPSDPEERAKMLLLRGGGGGATGSLLSRAQKIIEAGDRDRLAAATTCAVRRMLAPRHAAFLPLVTAARTAELARAGNIPLRGALPPADTCAELYYAY